MCFKFPQAAQCHGCAFVHFFLGKGPYLETLCLPRTLKGPRASGQDQPCTMEVWFRVLLVCWLLLQTMYLPHLANHCLGTQALCFSSLLPLSGCSCSALDDSSAHVQFITSLRPVPRSLWQWFWLLGPGGEMNPAAQRRKLRPPRSGGRHQCTQPVWNGS